MLRSISSGRGNQIKNIDLYTTLAGEEHTKFHNYATLEKSDVIRICSKRNDRIFRGRKLKLNFSCAAGFSAREQIFSAYFYVGRLATFMP